MAVDVVVVVSGLGVAFVCVARHIPGCAVMPGMLEKNNNNDLSVGRCVGGSAGRTPLRPVRMPSSGRAQSFAPRCCCRCRPTNTAAARNSFGRRKREHVIAFARRLGAQPAMSCSSAHFYREITRVNVCMCVFLSLDATRTYTIHGFFRFEIVARNRMHDIRKTHSGCFVLSSPSLSGGGVKIASWLTGMYTDECFSFGWESEDIWAGSKLLFTHVCGFRVCVVVFGCEFYYSC